MTTILKTGAPISAGQITDLGLAHDHVVFDTNWVGRWTTPVSFMVLTNFGQFQATRNKEIKMVQRTGVKKKYIATADFGDNTWTVGTVHAGILFDTYLGAGVDNFLREGFGFMVDGYTGVIGAGYAQHMELTIVGGNKTVGWQVRVDDAYSSNAGAIVAFDWNSTMGQTAFTIVGSEKYYGQAPEAFSLSPDTFSNWHQYFRVPFTYEHKAVAQDNYFKNIPENLREEANGLLLSQINDMLLRARRPQKDYANDTGVTGISSSLLYGSTEKRTRSGGIPWIIGYGVDANNMEGKIWSTPRFAAQTGYQMTLAAPTAAEARVFIDNLYMFGGQFDVDPRPLIGICGWNFYELVRRCLVASGYNPSYAQGVIEMPQVNLPYQEIALGNIRLRMVVDQTMDASESHGLVNYTAPLGGATVQASQVFAGNMMPVFNPTDITVSYAIDDAENGNGIRVPNVYPIGAIRNPNGTEMEYTAELTLVGQNRHKMGVFHQRDSLT